jgi:hypothetical protein
MQLADAAIVVPQPFWVIEKPGATVIAVMATAFAVVFERVKLRLPLVPLIVTAPKSALLGDRLTVPMGCGWDAAIPNPDNPAVAVALGACSGMPDCTVNTPLYACTLVGESRTLIWQLLPPGRLLKQVVVY